MPPTAGLGTEAQGCCRTASAGDWCLLQLPAHTCQERRKLGLWRGQAPPLCAPLSVVCWLQIFRTHERTRAGLCWGRPFRGHLEK